MKLWKKRPRKAKKKFSFQKIDLNLFFMILGLTFFGVLMVYNASVAEALRDFGDKYYYLKYQLEWAILGLFVLVICSLVPLKTFKQIALPLFLLSLVSLALVLVPGIGLKIKGARRWLNLGFVAFQPTEIIKLTFTLYLAKWLSSYRRIIHFFSLVGLLVVLIMLQPDFGTTVLIVSSSVFLYFLSGASIFKLLPLGLIAFLVGLLLIFSSPYRKERLMTFLNPAADPLGSSYHVRQILFALGSGGLFGVGLGQSRQKYEYLPEATTDSIFAIIAEETGFVGAGIVIILLFSIVWRGLQIAKRAPDKFSTLLAGGISIWFGLQTIINLGSMVAIMPLTGLPLPFISYGGSSLLSILAAAGILLNISRHEKKSYYKAKRRKR